MSKVWLITGSSRGLGRAIAEVALSAGHRLVATARRPDDLRDLVAIAPDRVHAVALDVTDAAAARKAVAAATSAFGRLDVLVNNAGYANVGAFEDLPEDDFRGQVETDFFGVVNVTRAALPVMRAQRDGHIIQISSLGGRSGTPGLSAYQASKWAVGGFSEVVAAEVRRSAFASPSSSPVESGRTGRAPRCISTRSVPSTSPASAWPLGFAAIPTRCAATPPSSLGPSSTFPRTSTHRCTFSWARTRCFSPGQSSNGAARRMNA